MKTALALILLAFTAFADTTHVSRGDLLKDRQYRSNADLNLFVDPTGLDSNACTSTGTAACLTFAGALSKAPKLLRHRLIITPAAGTYAGATISGFTVDPSVQKATAGILISGPLANGVPTTGSATGLATAGAAGTGAVFGTLTDSGATWTVNDVALVGKLVVITGGTGNGQVRVIVSNTATVLTIAGSWTAPTGTSTYALQAPSARITSPVAAIPTSIAGTGTVAAGFQVVDNMTGAAGDILLQNLEISPGVGVVGVVLTNSSRVGLTQVTSTGPLLTINPGTTGPVTITTSSAIVPASTIAVNGFGGSFSITNSMMKQSIGNNSPIVQITNGTASVSGSLLSGIVGLAVLQGTVGANPLGVGMIPTAVIASSRCDCQSAASSVCLSVGIKATGSASGTMGYGNAMLNGNLDVTDCTFGVLASGSGASVTQLAATVISGNALTYAVDVRMGAMFATNSTAQTLTGGTAELSVDLGTVTTTWAVIGVAPQNCLTNLGTSSRICRL